MHEAAPRGGFVFESSQPMSRARILDPHAVPVIGTDAHLRAVPPERLGAAALRARFAVSPQGEPELPGDGRVFDGREPADASVLVPLVAHESGVTSWSCSRDGHRPRGRASMMPIIASAISR